MRHLLLILCAILCWARPSAAQVGVDRVEGTWTEVKSLSRQTDRPIFIDFYADWCVTCAQMDRSVFQDVIIQDSLNTRFLFYKVNVDHFDGMDRVTEFGVTRLPTYVVTDGRGREMDRIEGATTIRDMTDFLKDLLR